MTDQSYRAAAAVLLMRRTRGAPLVFLTRRARTLSFLGGFHAFPGGCVDAIDERLGSNLGIEPRRVCALRELFEETGVLAAAAAEQWPQEERDALRTQVLGDSAAFGPLAERVDFRRAAAALVPIGVWRTPPYTRERYDATYFGLETSAEPVIWPGELDAGDWLSIEACFESHRRGERYICFPVLETLKGLAACDWDLPRASVYLALRTTETARHGGGEMVHGVHLLPLRSYTLPPATHTNCYLLGTERLVIVDPGSTAESETQRLVGYLEYMKAQGRELSEIWLTHQHPDHIGAVAALQSAFHLPVAAHELTAQALQGTVAVDRLLADHVEEVVSADSRWLPLHTPGHTQGHLCFYDTALRTMICGDVILGTGTVVIVRPDGDMRAYLQTLHELRAMDIGILFPGHGPPIAACEERIDFYIAHRLQRERSILEVLEVPRTTDDIVPLVYRDVDPSAWALAKLNVEAHLDKLVADGAVDAVGSGFRRR